MKKIMVITALFAFAFFAAVIVFFAATERGLNILAGTVMKNVPGLSVESVQGRLIGPIGLRGLRYTPDGPSFSVDAATLDWRPLSLFAGTVSLTSLEIEGVTVTLVETEQKEPSPPSRSLPAVSLPFNVSVKNVRLRTLTVTGEESDRPVFLLDELSAELRTEREVLHLKKLSVRTELFTLNANGRLRMAGDYPLSLRTEWSLRPPGYAPLSGAGEFTGDLRRLVVKQEAGPPTRGTLEATVSGLLDELRWEARLQIHDLKIREANPQWPEAVLNAVLEGSGDLSDFRFRSTYHALVPRHGKASGEIHAQVQSGRWDVNGEAKGDLYRLPLRASLRLEIDGERYLLREARLASGPAFLAASGRLDRMWDLKWEAVVPELDKLVPGGKGAFSAKGTLSGPRATPVIALRLAASGLSWGAWQAGEMDGDLFLDLRDAADSRLAFKAAELDLDGWRMTSTAVDAEGKLSDHRITATLDGEPVSVDILLQGRYREGRWQGVLKRTGIRSADWGDWTLDEPGPLLISLPEGPISAGAWCFTSAPSRVCLEADRRKTGQTLASVRAEKIALSLFQPLLPAGTEVAGSFDGDASALYDDEKLTGRLSITAPPGSISHALPEQEPLVLTYDGFSLNANLNPKALEGEFTLSLGDRGDIRGMLGLPGFSPLEPLSDTQPLRGSVAAEIRTLAFIPVFFPLVENTSGTLRADVKAAGTLARPKISGSVRLAEGAAGLPDLGIRLENVSFAASGDVDGPISIEAEAKSGPGILTVRGKAERAEKDGFSANVRITGEKVEAARLPEARVIASPALDVLVRGRRVEVKGEFGIPEADIREPRSPQDTAPLSGDVIIVSGVSAKEAGEKWEILSSIRVLLGERVTFSGYGLSGRVGGALVIAEEPGRLATAAGELRIVEGSYKAYGRTLEIERGRLVFVGGPLDNPGLDFRAVRKVDRVTAGVHAEGTLKEPQLRLFSEPSMDETDVLSYIILGRPMQSATSAEGRMLHNAALSLSLSGGERLARRIGGTFGIEEVRIDPGAGPQEASLVLGRHLSPRLYVSYGIGLFEQADTLRIRYKLGRDLMLQTESGDESGADLLYTIERP